MKRFFLILIVILVAYAQMSFFGAWRPFGVIPNLLMVLIIYIGLTRQATEAVGLALFGGFLLDMASGTDFGLMMAYYGLLALLVIVSKRVGADLDNLGLVLAYVVGATVIFEVAGLSDLALQHAELPFGYLLVRTIIEICANMVIAIIARIPLVRWMKPRTNLPVFGERRSVLL